VLSRLELPSAAGTARPKHKQVLFATMTVRHLRLSAEFADRISAVME
jgi:hypothetical protein